MERKEKFVTVPGAEKPKKPPRGVYCEYWERFAHRPRRELPEGLSVGGLQCWEHQCQRSRFSGVQ